MESAQIFSKVNAKEDVPYSWLVFPLIRQTVITGILYWIVGGILGGLLFAMMAPIMIPSNYKAGILPALFTTLVLGLVLFVCLGSLWMLVIDVIRVIRAKEHLIVITPEDFVKQEG